MPEPSFLTGVHKGAAKNLTNQRKIFNRSSLICLIARHMRTGIHPVAGRTTAKTIDARHIVVEGKGLPDTIQNPSPEEQSLWPLAASRVVYQTMI